MAAALAIDDYCARMPGATHVSEWVRVDQPMIDLFADATGDDQYIHVDPVRAAETPFGGTIAHGFLTLALMPRLLKQSDRPVPAGMRMGINYGCNRLRFLNPVPAGSRVRARMTTLAVTPQGSGRYQESIDYTVEIEGASKPALSAEWIALFII